MEETVRQMKDRRRKEALERIDRPGMSMEEAHLKYMEKLGEDIREHKGVKE